MVKGGRKRKSSGKKDESYSLPNRSSQAENGDHSNESKQRSKTKRQEGKLEERAAQSKPTTISTVEENEDRFEMEVDGQNTEFASEDGRGSSSEESEDEAMNELQQDENNNVMTERNEPRKKRSKKRQDSWDSETESIHNKAVNSSEEMEDSDEDEEDKMFAKWKKYLERKGLTISKIEENEMNKYNKAVGNEKRKKFRDSTPLRDRGKEEITSSNLETTIYRPAVLPLDKLLGKRNSSSSEEEDGDMMDLLDPEITFKPHGEILDNQFINQMRFTGSP